MKLPLTISLLASSRIRSLERCLDSLKPLLQTVPAELIVVFTGTDDGVRQVAERYTDQIVPFTWCNDFSAARNAGLKKAKGEWFLYLDDDEWFEDVTEICEFFQSGEYQNYRSSSYIQRNYLDWNGTKYSDFAAHRMAKLEEGLQFENPIHEELIPRFQPCKAFRSYVHHYGYLKDVVQKSSGKGARNIPLLLKDIEKRPEYTKNYLQLTQEYCTEKRWEEAEEACRKSRTICSSTEFFFESWLQYNLVYILYKKGDYAQAEKDAELILEKERPCELVRLILFLLLVEICGENKKPEKALKYGQDFEELLVYVEKHPKLWERQEYAEMNRDRVMAPEFLYPTRLNCVKAALELGEQEQAAFFLERLPWEEEYLIQKYYTTLDQWKKLYAPHLQKLLAGLSFDCSYLLVQKLDFQEEDVFLFRRCLKEVEQPYLQRQLVEKALREQRELSPLLERMDLEYWKACISEIIKDAAFTENPRFWEARNVLFENHPLQGWCMEKLLLEKELTRGFPMKEELKTQLEAYARCIYSFYSFLCREEMFAEEFRYLLPSECRLALVILDAMECWRQGRTVETLRLFREALQIHPQMTGVVVEMLRFLQNEIRYPASGAGPEFEGLAVQMKEALKTMVENRQYQEAWQVVNQLMPLLTEDLELLKIQQSLLGYLAE